MNVSILNLSFAWADEVLFNEAAGQLETGDILRLSGDNGSGKTTLLKLLCGMIPHFSRGRLLTGDITIDGESIVTTSPKHFFPKIAFIPNQNIDLFLLNRNLEEEILVIRTLMKLTDNTVRLKISCFNEMVSDFHNDLKLPFASMTFQQKAFSLALIYFIQGATLYLFDEMLDQSSGVINRQQWDLFLSAMATNGSIVLYVSHDRSSTKHKLWEIRNKQINF